MSRILITAANTNRLLQEMDITVRVHFKEEIHKNYPKWKKFMSELEEDFSAIAQKYFDDGFEIDTITNHEYNCRMNNH